jgi:predicted solute-binding protein
MSLKQQKPSAVSAEQRTSNELVKLIRKLRWMGMEEEAERVQTELAQCDVRRADSVLRTSHETD